MRISTSVTLALLKPRKYAPVSAKTAALNAKAHAANVLKLPLFTGCLADLKWGDFITHPMMSLISVPKNMIPRAKKS